MNDEDSGGIGDEGARQSSSPIKQQISFDKQLCDSIKQVCLKK